MKRILFLGLTIFVGILAVALMLIGLPKPTGTPSGINPENIDEENYPEDRDAVLDEPAEEFQEPLPRSAERVTKKPFGKFVEPGNSPVSPERFSGYHTAIDLEPFPDEIGREMEVKAVCEGGLMSKRNAQGYGGVVTQKCRLEDETITVVYGHLKLASVTAEAGENLEAGRVIGILGEEYSEDTDGERKHLHLGFYKGEDENILGYVPRQEMLSDWIDPCPYVCR